LTAKETIHLASVQDLMAISGSRVLTDASKITQLAAAGWELRAPRKRHKSCHTAPEGVPGRPESRVVGASAQESYLAAFSLHSHVIATSDLVQFMYVFDSLQEPF
jgi:hypothetical protein